MVEGEPGDTGGLCVSSSEGPTWGERLVQKKKKKQKNNQQTKTQNQNSLELEMECNLMGPQF